jgi:heme-degrading monooxygenase HmoA
MVLEVANIVIKPDTQHDFMQAVATGVTQCIAPAQGYVTHQLHHSIEHPDHFILHIVWQTLEDHTVGFRQSKDFTRWRSLVGPYFAQPPEVEHFNLVNNPP